MFSKWHGLMALMLSAVSAQAATAASEKSAGGPALKGVCVLNRGELFVTPKAAQAVNAEYRRRVEAAQNEVDKERQALEADIKALEAKKSAVKPEDFKKSQTDLGERLGKLQMKAQERTQELETQRRAVVARIAAAAQPLVEEIYKQRGCGLMLSRDAVLAGNPDMDVTPDVIALLDQRVPTLPFDAPEDTAKVGQRAGD